MSKSRTCTVGNLTDSLDLFSRPVYSFTFKKSPVVSTLPGIICSIVLVFTLTLFTLAKLQDYHSQVYNVVNVSEYVDRGYYDPSVSQEGVKIAFGLQYKEEYQAEMGSLKEEDLKKVVSMKMSMVEKVAGAVTATPLRVSACSTTDYGAFHAPRKSAESDMEYLKEHRPLYCV